MSFLDTLFPEIAANNASAAQSRFAVLQAQQAQRQIAAQNSLLGSAPPQTMQGPGGLLGGAGNPTVNPNTGNQMRYASQVTVPGQVGESLVGTPDEYNQQTSQLVHQADPQSYISTLALRDRLGALTGPQAGGSPTGGDPTASQLLAIDPSGKMYGDYVMKMNEPTPQQKVANAIASLPPDDPRRAYLENYLKKEGGMETDPNKIALTQAQTADASAGVAEKGAQTNLATTRNNLLTSSGLDDDTMERVYQQYKAGQSLNQIIPNLGRGQQGAQQIMNLQNYITKRMQADSANPSDFAASQVNLKAQTAAARTAAQRGANVDMGAIELGTFGDQALSALDKVDNKSFVPWNKLANLSASQISDPNLAAYQTALQGVRGAYASVISRGGVPTVEAQQKADMLLNAAQGPQAVKAIIAQMKREASGVQSSSQAVQKGIVGNVTGQGTAQAPVNAPISSVAPQGIAKWGRDANGNPVRLQ